MSFQVRVNGVAVEDVEFSRGGTINLDLEKDDRVEIYAKGTETIPVKGLVVALVEQRIN